MSTLNRSGTEILIDLINERYRTRLSVSDFDFGIPQAIEGRPDGTDTQVTLTSKDTTLLKGPTTFYYNRIDLRRLMVGRTRFLVIGRPRLTTQSICEWFETQFNILLTPSDIEALDIDLVESETMAVDLVAQHTSVVYQGIATIEVRYVNVVPPNAILSIEGEPIMTVEGEYILVMPEPSTDL